MSTAAESVVDPVPAVSPGTFADAVDRWIYVFMAALFFATALIGFIPDSLNKLAAIEAGQRAPFPGVLHVHAVLMGAWLTLLLAQTSLMATGRKAMHMQLGIASFILLPVIIATGFLLIPAIHGQIWQALQSAPPDAQVGLREVQHVIQNILLMQIRIGTVFTICVVLALLARHTDPSFHKRMIIMATLVPLPAAIDRIAWLPHTLPASPVSIDLYMFLWLMPMLLWDLYRQRRVHRAYLVFFALNVPFIIAVNLLWNDPWWQATAPHLVGTGG